MSRTPLNPKIKLIWLNGPKVCLSKCLGGFGLKNMRGTNSSLLAKNSWRLMKVIMVFGQKVFDSKYVKGDMGQLLNDKTALDSVCIWKCALEGTKLLHKGYYANWK